MKNKRLLNLMALVLISVPIIYFAVLYQKLPQTIPVHFGLDGKPDRYGDRSELLVPVGILAAVSGGLYLLFTNIHKIDPKRSAKLSRSIIERISLAVLLFMSILGVIIIHSSYTTELVLDRFMLPLMGLLFAYLGNVMYSIKPNYFAGFRTPWALEDEDNWRKTHHLAGKLWFGGGVLIAIFSLFLPFIYALGLTISIVIIITIIPAVFSYRYFRTHNSNLNNNL